MFGQYHICLWEKNMNNLTFHQTEQVFRDTGPYVHLYSSALESGTLMDDDADRTVFLNAIALTSKEIGMEVLAYALMSNHFHLILRADEAGGRMFFDIICRKVFRYLTLKGKGKFLDKISPGTTAITTLKQLRNEIAYVIRNPYVVREDVNLFSYLWCSGYLYFNPLVPKDTGIPAEKVSLREKRAISRSRDGIIPDGLRIKDGLVTPGSFVNYELVETLFGCARTFHTCTLRNVEAQSEIAMSHGELPNLSDDEIYVVSCRLRERMFGVKTLDELLPSHKKELAVELKNKYNASNGQIARMSGLSIADVNAMYPLSAKKY